jgi:hypothetical protein
MSGTEKQRHGFSEKETQIELYCLADPEFYDSANGEPERPSRTPTASLSLIVAAHTCHVSPVVALRPASART